VAKETFKIKLEGKRKVRKPGLRWMEDVENDLWEPEVKKWI
jgi:hypothetical protein